MKEIEELKKQKEQIENKIRELTVGTMFFNVDVPMVKIDRVHYTGDRPDEWFLAVKMFAVDKESKRPIRWMSIIRAHKKEDLLEKLDPIVDALIVARDRLRKEKEE